MPNEAELHYIWRGELLTDKGIFDRFKRPKEEEPEEEPVKLPEGGKVAAFGTQPGNVMRSRFDRDLSHLAEKAFEKAWGVAKYQAGNSTGGGAVVSGFVGQEDEEPEEEPSEMELFDKAWGLAKYDYGEDIPEPIRRTLQLTPEQGAPYRSRKFGGTGHSMGETMTDQEVEDLRVKPVWEKGRSVIPWSVMNPGRNQAQLMRDAHIFLGGRPEAEMSEINAKGPWKYSSKMPGPGTAFPTHFCRMGRKLRAGKKSMCGSCNVHGGKFGVSAQREKAYRQYRGLADTDRWASAFSHLAPHHARAHSSPIFDNQALFRHNIAGEMENVDQYRMYDALARYDPDTQYWLPTIEQDDLASFVGEDRNIAPNFQMSLSNPLKDIPPDLFEAQMLEQYPQLAHPNVRFTGAGEGEEKQFCPGVCLDEGCMSCFMGGKNSVWSEKAPGRTPAKAKALRRIVPTPTPVSDRIRALRARPPFDPRRVA